MNERFTLNQLRYSAAMKSLIGLYYGFASIEGDDWQTPHIEDLLKMFLRNLFGFCLRVDKNDRFHFDLYHHREVKKDAPGTIEQDIGPEYNAYNTGSAEIGTLIRDVWIGKDELNAFKGLMDSLCEAVQAGETCHFNVQGFRDEIDTGFEKIEHDDPVQNDSQYKTYENLSAEVERMVVESLRSGMRSQEIIGDRYVRIDPYRIIMASPASEFGKKVIYAVPQEEHPYEIPHIYSASCYQFLQIIRSLFVIYQIEFNSYDRIKLCAYCNKLFFEKKKGTAVYCSSGCRKKDYDSRQSREKTLCRERQNAWIRNRFLGKPGQVYNAGSHECFCCDSPVKSGECPIILEKNKDRLII